MQPAIYGLSGERLTADERAFFRDADPAGYILFRRNCADKAQLRALTDDLRSLHGRDRLPVLIDQEGGRVARLQPPAWPRFPAARRFAELYRLAPISAVEAARLNALAMALLLEKCGVTVDCMPVLDLAQEGAHDIIGDRSLGADPMQVAALGRALLEGLLAGGVVGVVKHVPGHGRATCDSHFELPVVSASETQLQADLEPFRTLRWAPMAMVAHVVYAAWDEERCASLSAPVISGVVRAEIGFEGFLMSDDIGMQALSGSLAERTLGVIAAGCDVALHCSGVLGEMVEVADALGDMRAESAERLERAMASVSPPLKETSYEELAERRDALLAYA